METWAFVKLLLTILTPILGLGVGVWINRRQSNLIHEEMEDVDANILAHLKGNPAGLANLAHQLERLRREATRKRRHP